MAFRYFDYLDDGPPARVFARISVLRTENGGRQSPFTTHFRPNHNFGDEENARFYIGQVEVPRGEWVFPGETRNLWIEFLSGPHLVENLTIGRKWRIQEGPRLVAMAEILEIQ